MSYNIDHSEYIGEGRLKIKRSVVQKLISKYKDLAEGNFLEELNLEGDGEELLEIEEPWWYGEFSGTGFDTLKEILSKTIGKATILFVWEGGDSQTALEVKDGVVKGKKVKIVVED